MFFSTILGHFASNPAVQAEANSVAEKLTAPAQFYRQSCIKLLDEIRALHLKMFTNQTYPEVLMYRHEYNKTGIPSDGILRPPFDLKPEYHASDYQFGDNILREQCMVSAAHISVFLTQLNKDAAGTGRLRKGVGNQNDSVRVILNLVLHTFITLSLIDVKNISELSEPILYTLR